MQTSARNVDAVFLDAGGVLLLPHPDVILGALDAAGIRASRDPEVHALAHHRGAAALAEFPLEHAEVWAAYQDAYARTIEVGEADLEAARAVLGEVFPLPHVFSRPVPGVLDDLRALGATGVRMAVVSNANGQVAGLLLDAGLCAPSTAGLVHVEAVVDSHVVGVAKPDPRIFEIALEAVGTSADRALHVGDVVGADVAGALAAGVRPVHMDPYRLCTDDDHEHVQSLRQVVTLVRT